MRFIEIDLDGTVVRAKLNEEKAPKTSEAVWNVLPFEGKAVHAQISGEMFRMLDHAPTPPLEIEARVSHQWPGAVVYYPPINEIAFCAGEARFSGGATPAILTLLAEIEGDMTAFLKKGDSLDRTGAKPIRFRRAADQTTPFRHQTFSGPKIELEFDGAKVGATLRQDLGPKTVAALQKLLPLEGDATNHTLGGGVTRFWPTKAISLDAGDDKTKTLHWPGYIYYQPDEKGLFVVYGEGEIRNVAGYQRAIPVATIDGADLETYAAKARAQLTEGVKKLAIRAK